MTNLEEGLFIPIAIPFKRYHELEGQVQEYNINFRSEDSSLDDLIDFISYDFVHRVNLCFIGKINPKIVSTANKVKDCIYVRVMPEQCFQVTELRDNDVRFFYDSTMSPSCYSELAEYIHMGVSDVYIVDDLTYNLEDVKKLCHSHNVHLRTILNRMPMTTLNKGKDVKSTIYRPQDIELLKQYYDVFEFDCGEPYNWNIFNVVYKAFFINQNWYGNLAEINPDIQFVFHNEQVLPHYTAYKTKCQRVCDQRVNNPCKKCEQFINIGNTLFDKGVALK